MKKKVMVKVILLGMLSVVWWWAESRLLHSVGYL